MSKEKLVSALSKLRQAELGLFPTPLHRLKNMEAALSYDEIFIKRDDLTGLGPGGKKLRSLEFILGDALAAGADTIIAHGPGQSNLCATAAAACAKLGLKCILIHNAEEPTHYEGNLLLNKVMDVESHFLGKVTQQERKRYASQFTEKLRSQGKTPYEIKNGGTTGLGIIGHVKLALELANQCEERGLSIKTIFAPAGNGSMAGLIYGNALLGKPFNIVIISVERSRLELSEIMNGCIADAEKILQLPFDQPLEDAATILDEYLGEGWGCNTPESAEAVRRMPRTEGIFIENVYTSKVWVGLEDCLRKRKDWGGVCYLHTGGFSSLFSQMKF